MAIEIRNNELLGSNVADVDSYNSLKTTQATPPGFPGTGGYFTIGGQVAAVVAVSLAANSSLMSMRYSLASLKKAYITKCRVVIAPATTGAFATIPGTLGLQRFNGATPTGGTARVPNRLSEWLGAGSDMTDIRDNNAALTVTNVAFGSVVSNAIVPLFFTGGSMWYEWIVEPTTPIVLTPGDGLALRTQVVMPALQTWVYSYTFHWYER